MIPAGATIAVQVRAVDRAGNVGPAVVQTLKVSGREPKELPAASESAAKLSKAPPQKLPRLGGAEIAIIDQLDKVQPVTGEMIPKRPESYLAQNHLWDAGSRTIQLFAARNEFVAFQILIRGAASGVVPELKFENEKSPPASVPSASFGILRHVASKRGPLPDPVVPLAGPTSVPATDEQIAGQRSGSLLCEIYVPHEATAGMHRAVLTLRSGDQKLELPIELHVWNFTLPDYLSFLPEMNATVCPAQSGNFIGSRICTARC